MLAENEIQVEGSYLYKSWYGKCHLGVEYGQGVRRQHEVELYCIIRSVHTRSDQIGIQWTLSPSIPCVLMSPLLPCILLHLNMALDANAATICPFTYSIHRRMGLPNTRRVNRLPLRLLCLSNIARDIVAARVCLCIQRCFVLWPTFTLKVSRFRGPVLYVSKHGTEGHPQWMQPSHEEFDR